MKILKKLEIDSRMLIERSKIINSKKSQGQNFNCTKYSFENQVGGLHWEARGDEVARLSGFGLEQV